LHHCLAPAELDPALTRDNPITLAVLVPSPYNFR
jgi:hypothetical protein